MTFSVYPNPVSFFVEKILEDIDFPNDRELAGQRTVVLEVFAEEFDEQVDYSIAVKSRVSEALEKALESQAMAEIVLRDQALDEETRHAKYVQLATISRKYFEEALELLKLVLKKKQEKEE